MLEFAISILVNAFLLFVVGQIVSGINVQDGKAAIWGALALGLANWLVRPVLVILTLPVTVLTLGLFLLVINALMLMLAAALVDGFEVEDFGSAVVGSLVFAVMNFLVGWLVF
ncbi:MAG: phage holin family protein [Longimicrobiales bacterium]|nr:phage holin family protein [Longimicrobiales bacterium]